MRTPVTYGPPSRTDARRVRTPSYLALASAGVEIVVNGDAEPELAVMADTVLVSGGEDHPPAASFRVRRTLVDVDESGKAVGW